MTLLIGFFINLLVRIKTPSCNISSTIRQPSNASTTASMREHAPQLPGISEHFLFLADADSDSESEENGRNFTAVRSYEQFLAKVGIFLKACIILLLNTYVVSKVKFESHYLQQSYIACAAAVVDTDSWLKRWCCSLPRSTACSFHRRVSCNKEMHDFVHWWCSHQTVSQTWLWLSLSLFSFLFISPTC